MIGSELKLTLNALGRLLTEGNVERLSGYFECPLPIYMDDKFFLFETRETLTEVLEIFTSDAARTGVRRLEPVLLKVEDATPNRSMFVVQWNYLLEDGSCCRVNVVRYVGRRGQVDGMLRMELVEYLKIGCVDVQQQLVELVVA